MEVAFFSRLFGFIRLGFVLGLLRLLLIDEGCFVFEPLPVFLLHLSDKSSIQTLSHH